MRVQSIQYHTFITALRQCWTVSSCQTFSLISIMSIILDQPKPFHFNLITLKRHFYFYSSSLYHLIYYLL